MKKSILIVLASILMSYPMSLMGADFETPHEFSAGDTISAEMMNELFTQIKLSQQTITEEDLFGTWSLIESRTAGHTNNSNITGMTSSPNGLTMSRESTVTFSKNNNGTFNWNQPTYSSFHINCVSDSNFCNSPGAGTYAILNGIIIFDDTNDSTPFSDSGGKSVFKIEKISETRLLINVLNKENFVSISLDKLNLTPNPPSSLTYALPSDNTSSSITLTWTDNQTGAITGYKVNRKTVVTDNFTTVSTITDNTTRTYADDNVTESGKYWYRVLAYNSNGDGTPSKVVKASFPDDEAPTGTLKIDNATTTTTSSSVTLNLTATDNKGVVGYLASESSAPPSTDSTSWVSITSTTSYSADVSFTLSSGDGVKFVYVWFKDGKGNIAGYGASITYSSQ